MTARVMDIYIENGQEAIKEIMELLRANFVLFYGYLFCTKHQTDLSFKQLKLTSVHDSTVNMFNRPGTA